MVVFRRLGREEKEKRTSNRPVGRFVSLHNRYTPSIQSWEIELTPTFELNLTELSLFYKRGDSLCKSHLQPNPVFT